MFSFVSLRSWNKRLCQDFISRHAVNGLCYKGNLKSSGCSVLCLLVLEQTTCQDFISRHAVNGLCYKGNLKSSGCSVLCLLVLEQTTCQDFISRHAVNGLCYKGNLKFPCHNVRVHMDLYVCKYLNPIVIKWSCINICSDIVLLSILGFFSFVWMKIVRGRPVRKDECMLSAMNIYE